MAIQKIRFLMFSHCKSKLIFINRLSFAFSGPTRFFPKALAIGISTIFLIFNCRLIYELSLNVTFDHYSTLEIQINLYRTTVKVDFVSLRGKLSFKHK